MKVFILLSLLMSSSILFAVDKKTTTTNKKEVSIAGEKKEAEAPCDSTEEVLKKLEAKKEESKKVNQAFSLQGKNDSGCSLK